MKALTILLLIFCFSFSVSAQSNPQQLIDRFFNQYTQISPISALDYLFGTNKYLNQNQDGLSTIKNSLNGLLEVIGPYKDFELFDQNDLGTHYRRYRYLVRYERQPLIFTFIVYRPDTQWLFQNFVYDTDLEILMQEPKQKQL
jgi:hypothetical protein